MTTRVYLAVALDRTDDETGRGPSTEAIREELESLIENTSLDVEGRYTYTMQVVGIGGSHTALDESLRARRENMP